MFATQILRSAPPPMVNGEGGGAEQGGEEGGGEAKSEKPAGPKSMIDGCDGFQCKKLCIGPADINWPQAVGSGVLKIVLHGATSKDCLGQVHLQIHHRRLSLVFLITLPQIIVTVWKIADM